MDQRLPFVSFATGYTKRLRSESVTIVIFFRITFPTSEVFDPYQRGQRCCKIFLPLMLWDLHFSHTRHFLTACARYVGVGSQSQMGDLCINYEGRNVMVCTNHVGLEAEMISRRRSHNLCFQSQSVARKTCGTNIFASFEWSRLNGVTLTLWPMKISSKLIRGVGQTFAS